jgi:hypothetical protein
MRNCVPNGSASTRTDMSVERYRSIEEMPRVWRAADDPENLRLVAQMLGFYRSLVRSESRPTGVQRFRAIEAADAALDDPFRR